ncbi:MAG TPA: NRDE family protein [Azospirillaceae bacterium]|nr:NRDE family protein [Azospirillaceae bacterium]
MCSVVILRRPDADWPIILGANRDEMSNRPWRPPGRHWPDRANVVAGLDEMAGGTWMGVNDEGVMACVLNREGTLGPEDGKRSRGELVLEALDHADAAEAALALADLNAAAWRPFNLVIADNRDAFVLSHRGEKGRIRPVPIPEGLSMVTAFDLNDDASPRIRFYRPLFAHAAPPAPERGEWAAWEKLLASRIRDGQGRSEAGPKGAMCVVTPSGFGTSSSSLVALPSAERSDLKPVWRFAPGRPGEVAWENVPLRP